jgi:hypothetical protein
MGYMALPPVRAAFQFAKAMPHFGKSGILALAIIEFQLTIPIYTGQAANPS